MRHLTGLPYSRRRNGHEFQRTTREMPLGKFCALQRQRIKQQLEWAERRYQRRMGELTSIEGNEVVVVETRDGTGPPRRHVGELEPEEPD